MASKTTVAATTIFKVFGDMKGEGHKQLMSCFLDIWLQALKENQVCIYCMHMAIFLLRGGNAVSVWVGDIRKAKPVPQGPAVSVLSEKFM